MKLLIKLEEVGLFILSMFLFVIMDYPWWLFPLLLFVPDISILAYAFGAKTGSYIYNIFHHRGISIAMYIAGAFLNYPLVQLIGLILFAHSSIDRIFGYGLKFPDSFSHSHLGYISEIKSDNP